MVYNMVGLWVVHDALEKCHQWIVPVLLMWVFLGNIGGRLRLKKTTDATV